MISAPIEVQMTSHEIAMARMYLVYVVPFARKSGWIVLTVFAMLSLAAHLLVGGRFETWGEYLVGFIALATSWLLFGYTRERGRKEVARMYEEGFTLTLREEGVLYQVGEAFEILPWTKFTQVRTAGRWLFLYFDANWALIIPQKAFASNAEFGQWVGVAKQKIAR